MKMKNRLLQVTILLCVIGVTTAGALALPISSPAARQTTQSSFEQHLAAARLAYFKDVEGDHEAHTQARDEFAALAKEKPGDAVVEAYIGSLDLLEAARTWAVWNKHTLSQQGLHELDQAVNQDPTNLEARFIRAATTWHLPFFFHRREQAEGDFAYIAPRAADAVAAGTLPPQLAAAALDYYGQVLSERSDHTAAKNAYEAAVRIDQSSPGGQDASRRLKQAD
jgi:tetratricopeptide (TPR) repeat protein